MSDDGEPTRDNLILLFSSVSCFQFWPTALFPLVADYAASRSADKSMARFKVIGKGNMDEFCRDPNYHILTWGVTAVWCPTRKASTVTVTPQCDSGWSVRGLTRIRIVNVDDRPVRISPWVPTEEFEASDYPHLCWEESENDSVREWAFVVPWLCPRDKFELEITHLSPCQFAYRL
jgi:hypothetical protein